jgi:hypothetical protein
LNSLINLSLNKKDGYKIDSAMLFWEISNYCNGKSLLSIEGGHLGNELWGTRDLRPFEMGLACPPRFGITSIVAPPPCLPCRVFLRLRPSKRRATSTPSMLMGPTSTSSWRRTRWGIGMCPILKISPWKIPCSPTSPFQ